MLAYFVTAVQAAATVTLRAAYDLTGGYDSIIVALTGISVVATGAIFMADRRKSA